MIEAILILLICQMIGETVVASLHLPIPGPVLGMILLFTILWGRSRISSHDNAEIPVNLGKASDTLLLNLSLLFVPAAVGIIQHLDLLREFGLSIFITLVVSTIATLAVTALIFEYLIRRKADKIRALNHE